MKVKLKNLNRVKEPMASGTGNRVNGLHTVVFDCPRQVTDEFHVCLCCVMKLYELCLCILFLPKITYFCSLQELKRIYLLHGKTYPKIDQLCLLPFLLFCAVARPVVDGASSILVAVYFRCNWSG